MSKVRVALMSLLAVSAVSVFASAAASAGPTHIFKIEGSELKGTEIGVEADSLSGKIEFSLFWLPLVIQCEEDISRGRIKEKGKSETTIEFKDCFVAESEKGKKVILSSCTITEPVIAEAKGELTAHGVDTLKGNKVAINEIFSEFQIGTCAEKGVYQIKGSEACATPESEYEKVIHIGICTPAGSNVLMEKEGPEPGLVQFFGKEQIKLVTKKNWSAT
jgi:hypothetical protein